MDTSNWLDDKQRIMVGGKPHNENDLEQLFLNKITVIVNLTTAGEIRSKSNFHYQELLPSHVKYIHFPIKDMSVTQDDLTLQLVEKIIELTVSNRVYVHCKGGHGRTGVIAGLLVHNLYPNLSYTEVIQYVQKQHATRKVKPYASSPQTSPQFHQLHRIIENSEDILFYDKKCPHYMFSNFYTHPKERILFTDKNGKSWYSSEAYYQAHKFAGTSLEGDQYAEIIRLTTSAHFAYLLGKMGGNVRPNWKIDGRSVTEIIKTFKPLVKIYADWDERKETVMRDALMYKFSQNDDLKSSLLKSGLCRLVEYSPRDMYWGTFWNKKGQNRLGGLLESVRKELL